MARTGQKMAMYPHSPGYPGRGKDGLDKWDGSTKSKEKEFCVTTKIWRGDVESCKEIVELIQECGWVCVPRRYLKHRLSTVVSQTELIHMAIAGFIEDVESMVKRSK